MSNSSTSIDRGFHARIIEGCGLDALASAARRHCRELLCEHGGCGTCAVCRKVDTEQHPDVLYLLNGEKSVPVEAVRALRSQMWVMPNEGKAKIAVIGDASLLNPACQNALLTLLEEPPSYGVIFLLCTSRAALLPTVRSRCVAEQAGGEATESPPDDTAKALWDALTRRDELLVLRAALRWDKLPRQDFMAALDGLNALFSERLGDFYREEPKKNENKRLTPAEILRMMDSIAYTRGALAVNAGTGHICGALAADLFEALSGGFPS